MVLADLGLARAVDAEQDYYRISSDGHEPIRWMCPLAISLRRFTKKSDVWSFGVLCTFRGGSAFAIDHHHPCYAAVYAFVSPI